MKTKLSYYGIAFFQLNLEDGRTILIDPCITINPDAPVKIEDVKAPDAVLVTHAARDHIGDTVEIMRGGKGVLLCPRNVKTYVTKKGLTNVDAKAMVAGMEREVNGIKVKAFETRHGGYIECDGQFLSDVSLAYMFYLRRDLKLLHLGDTGLFGDLKMIGDVYKPDIVLIPIGMFKGQAPELHPWEAALAISWLKPKIAIPMHYDLDVERESPAAFEKSLREISPSTKMVLLRPGESIEI